MFDCPVAGDTARHYARETRDSSLDIAIDSETDLLLDEMLAAETPKQLEARNSFIDEFLSDLCEPGNEQAKDQAYFQIMKLIRLAYGRDRSLPYEFREFSEKYAKHVAAERLLEREASRF